MSRQRVWLLSPSIATAVFFVVQIFLSFSGQSTSDRIAAASADAPSPVPVQVRVVAEIQPLEKKATTAAVPDTEEALFELIERDGTVTFGSEEVDVVETSEREFEAIEVGVIRARATLAP